MKETTVFLILFGASGAALAHPEHAVGGVLHGFAHPFGGVDHLLAMVLVGLWAARRRGWTRLLLPCAFVGGMLAGALLGLAGAPLPAVEPMIMVSIAVFAAALLAAAHVAPAPSAALIALFALFHGYAHLAEIPDGAPVAGFAAGMVGGTALLHAIGLALGLAIAWRAPLEAQKRPGGR
jgi:urease accessory protein